MARISTVKFGMLCCTVVIILMTHLLWKCDDTNFNAEKQEDVKSKIENKNFKHRYVIVFNRHILS